MKYLIPCSKRKKNPELFPNDAVESNLENLSFNNTLGDRRNEIVGQYTAELNWGKCLPAYKLYDGMIYTPISDENWENNGDSIYIMSALFGLVKHDDKLPLYDLNICSSNNLNKGKTPKSIWQRQNLLCEVLQGEMFTDLLSDNYRLVVPDCKVLVRPGEVDFRYDRGPKRGKWLNDKLNE